MAQTINLDVSQRVDIVCRRGDTFDLTLTYTKDDGTGDANFGESDTFLLQVRDADTNDTSIITEVTGTPNSTTKKINFQKSFAAMKEIASGLYVYDVEHKTSAGVVSTLIFGTFKVNEDVTIGS
tara:strand:- start:65 stop:436 length:372 start_codon:yes stop_codon:yes gene_type:complete